MTEAEREKAFLDVVNRIPTHWTCIRCRRRFRNDPGGTQPMGFTTETQKDGTRVVDGNICADCWKQ